jgi:CRP/FNR family transcriptional regulator, cyclic AMP receptor protein
MHDDPEIVRLLGQLANTGNELAIGVVCDLLIPTAPRRIAAVLLRVTGAHEGIEPTDPAGFYLTQSDISDLANASRIYVSRVLGKFAKAGWIATSYGHIRLVDIEALTTFAYSEGEE